MNTNKHEFGGAMRAAGSRRQARIECSIDMMDKMDKMDRMDSGMESRGAAAKLAAAAMIMAVVAGCSTEIKVNGNYNTVDTSPAKYAGYGGTVDVLKGMSLPSVNWGSSSAKATEDGGKEEKNATEEENKAAELPAATEEAAKNVGSGVVATVETPEAKVTEDKVVVKEENK